MKMHQQGSRQTVEVDSPNVKVALLPGGGGENDYQLVIQRRKDNGFYGNRMVIPLSDLDELESLSDVLGALYGKEIKRLRHLQRKG